MTKINFSDIQIINGRNVRYQGKAQDKCDISYLIHEVAFAVGHRSFPLWSDIYWYTSTKKELVDYLLEFLSRTSN